MKRQLLFVCAVACMVAICAGPVLLRADVPLSETTVIEVAPNVLNLASQGSWVTVHTDIPYGEAVAADVTLNGVDIAWSKSDNQGNFVAKFVIAAIKDIVEPGDEATLELVVLTTAGIEFIGSDTVKVISVKGR